MILDDLREKKHEELLEIMETQLQEQMKTLLTKTVPVNKINWIVEFPAKTHQSLRYQDSAMLLEELKCRIEELFVEKNYAVVKQIGCHNRMISSSWIIEIIV